jgi:hypothetical protein
MPLALMRDYAMRPRVSPFDAGDGDTDKATHAAIARSYVAD